MAEIDTRIVSEAKNASGLKAKINTMRAKKIAAYVRIPKEMIEDVPVW